LLASGVPETAAVSELEGLGAADAGGPAPAAELPAEPPDTPSRQPDTVRAFRAGVTVECEIDGFGFPLRVRLGVLVTDGQ
jgi:hypothetical protein